MRLVLSGHFDGRPSQHPANRRIGGSRFRCTPINDPAQISGERSEVHRVHPDPPSRLDVDPGATNCLLVGLARDWVRFDEHEEAAWKPEAAAGISISGVASIAESSSPVPYPVYYGNNFAGAPGKDVQTPVAPGSIEVTVSVVYLIG